MISSLVPRPALHCATCRNSTNSGRRVSDNRSRKRARKPREHLKNPQPKIVVFPEAEILVEQPDPLEYTATDQDANWEIAAIREEVNCEHDWLMRLGESRADSPPVTGGIVTVAVRHRYFWPRSKSGRQGRRGNPAANNHLHLRMRRAVDLTQGCSDCESEKGRIWPSKYGKTRTGSPKLPAISNERSADPSSETMISMGPL